MYIDNKYNNMGTRDNRFNLEQNDQYNRVREGASEIIIDDTTIYEIDLDCCECFKNRKRPS